ncbi:hypothetical protein JZO78_04430 [Enterococcus ureilyticus]|uniref:hypothetical protein n=1 Tax=Enterococcus ureilyticus TaxID=1131292 RepID=UPI001A912C9C|nr:hypothetical protein [Enterococcus ureilyticus]MBO0445582.1 hypothetical protein [Enterococcus ureilyticus]
MTPEEAKLMTQNYFEKHNLLFEGAYPVNKGKERELHIHVFGPKGRFMMRMQKDATLYTQNSTRKKWIKIEKY